MLFAIYGLRESEVARLRLDDIDWEHDQLDLPGLREVAAFDLGELS